MSVYLITGFTGSLGSVITRRLLEEGHKVRGVARGEHKIQALVKSFPKNLRDNLSAFCGDVRDQYRLWMAFHDVDYLIHGAAMKVVGQCEYDPEEAIKTNIDGTMNVINACMQCNVKRAVFISSDKCVLGINLYGMTKAVAERLWLNANRYSAGKSTEFVAVRYGNVFSSNGSVVPIWREQMKKGPISITDPECTRFHFRLNDAVDFVLNAVRDAKVGELRVPLLPSYRLRDLAEAVAPGHDRRLIGLQLGEKRHELMMHSHESIYSRKDGNFYTLTPGTVQSDKEFEYSSGGNPWRLSVAALKEEIRLLENPTASS